MTKAELKKLETEQKHEFIARVYATVLSCIPEQTIMLRKHLQIRLTHQGYNRYVRFHSYGMDMNIQIFGDGNVGIELNETLHNEHTEQLFEYASEKEVQEVFLTNLKALITVLIRIFTAQAVFDFHSYMDYVGGSTTAAEAYQQMMADYQRATKES